jgi:hypothetical protein
MSLRSARVAPVRALLGGYCPVFASSATKPHSYRLPPGGRSCPRSSGATCDQQSAPPYRIHPSTQRIGDEAVPLQVGVPFLTMPARAAALPMSLSGSATAASSRRESSLRSRTSSNLRVDGGADSRRRSRPDARSGGARGARTPDLLHAMQALSQLSYGPAGNGTRRDLAPLIGDLQSDCCFGDNRPVRCPAH